MPTQIPRMPRTQKKSFFLLNGSGCPPHPPIIFSTTKRKLFFGWLPLHNFVLTILDILNLLTWIWWLVMGLLGTRAWTNKCKKTLLFNKSIMYPLSLTKNNFFYSEVSVQYLSVYVRHTVCSKIKPSHQKYEKCKKHSCRQENIPFYTVNNFPECFWCGLFGTHCFSIQTVFFYFPRIYLCGLN